MMFTRRRSSSSLDKSPCLNTALLTCYLLLIGHVSSMSLDRSRRQYQQQNDKQLELSELMLPEAGSEMLQNDMELVSADDGNSDMYLLVPASAVNKQQNFQNSGNVESNSDMLMQESEDAPAAQVLIMPENELKSQIREELVANNELDQEINSAKENKEENSNNAMSESTLNNLAAAAEEIETELVGSGQNTKIEELIPAENAKQAEINTSSKELLIGDENGEAENAAAVSGQEEKSSEQSTEASHEMGKINEDLQLNLPSEDSEMQPTAVELNQQSLENISENSDSNESFPAIKLTETMNDANNVSEDSEISKNGEPMKSVIEIEKEKPDEHLESQDIDGIRKDIELESIKVISEEALDDGKEAETVKDNPAEPTVEEEQINEEIESLLEPSVAGEKNQMKIELSQAEKTEDEIDSADEGQAEDMEEKIKPIGDETQSEIKHTSDEVQTIPIEILSAEDDLHSVLEGESLEESQANQYAEYIPPSEDIGDSEDLSTDEKEPTKENQLEHEIQIVGEKDDKDQLSLQSQIIEQINKQIADEESIGSNGDATVQPLLSDDNVEETQIGQEQVQSVVETSAIEDAENAENSESKEESQLQTQLKEDSPDIDESQQVEISQAPEHIQTAEEPHIVDEKIEEVSLPAQETQNEKETEAAEEGQDAEDIQYPENIKSEEGSQSDELTHSIENMQTSQETMPVNEVLSLVESQPIKNEQDENNDSDPSESSQVVDEIELEKNPLEEHQTESEVSDTTDAAVEDESVVGSGVEIQSMFEENESTDDEAKPLDMPSDKVNAEESTDQPNVLDNGNTFQSLVEEIQDTTAEDKDTDNVLNNDNNESEPIKETTSMVAADEEPAQQQQHEEEHQQPEQLEEHQTTVVESVDSVTSQTIVLDSVQNYVNASYTNPISSSENNNKQEVKDEEEQLFNSKLRRYDGAQVWRIVVQNDKERKLADELQSKYDGQLWKEVKQEVDYLLKPQVLADAEKYVRAANLTRIVLIDNLQTVIEVENPPAEQIAQLQNRKGYRLTWQAYHRLEDIHGYFDYLAKTYTDICSVEIIGYSIEKRPLKILKISNGNANNTGMWIDGGMHAREWISPAVATYVAHQIVEGWDDLPAYMRNINWYIHAVANPDGYEYSHTTDRLWRKNMRSHGRACPGVDLNRNFGYKWGGKGTSANPCSQTYRGSKAFSEPETFYISKFISNFPRETFKGYLSFHSYGQYILYPWGYDYHITKDMADLDLVARQAGTIITKSTGSKFTVGSSATTLYPAAGGSDDWAKGIAGIKYSYTIEMGDTGRYGFVLPAEYIEPNGKNGLTVVQTVAKAITMGKNGRRRKLKAYKNH